MVIPKQIIYPLSYFCSMFHCNDGSSAAAFSAEMQAYLGSPHPPLALGRASMGIYLLTKLSLSDTRKKVILSSYTIPDVVNMVVLAGGEPVFVDVEAGSTNIDLNNLETLLGSDVACVFVTHYHVNQKQIQEIKSICEQHSILLFEDCAISLGGSIDGDHVGLCSDGGVLSMSGYKFLNYYWGGMVFSKHPKINDALKLLMSGWNALPRSAYIGQIAKILRYDLATRPYIFRLATFQYLRLRQKYSTATVQLSTPRLETESIDNTLTALPNQDAFGEWKAKLPLVNQNMLHRRKIAAIYGEVLGDIMVASDTPVSILKSSCFVNYPIVVDASRRDALYKNIVLSGIDVGLSLYPCCGRFEKFGGFPGKTDNAALLERSVLTLPTHPRVTPEYAMKIAGYINALVR